MAEAKQIIIWTAAYRPFIMGGNVNAPIATTYDVVGEPIDLGKGIKVWVIVSPKGTIHIADAETGAFVGDNLDQVKTDVAEADEEVMKQQLVDAKVKLKGATHLPPDKFWGRFR